jgi:hypothetical protein
LHFFSAIETEFSVSVGNVQHQELLIQFALDGRTIPVPTGTQSVENFQVVHRRISGGEYRPNLWPIKPEEQVFIPLFRQPPVEIIGLKFRGTPLQIRMRNSQAPGNAFLSNRFETMR